MNEVVQSVPDQEVLTQYGYGPIRLSGCNDALHERHLLFDDVVAPEAAGPRERFEAAARSVRDVRLTGLYADGDARARKAILNVTGWEVLQRPYDRPIRRRNLASEALSGAIKGIGA